MTNQLVKYDDGEVRLLRDLYGKGVNDAEFYHFLKVCESRGLSPFNKEIYAVKRGGGLTIQVGIDGLRLIAERTGEHLGTDDVVYDTLDGKHPGTATVTVYRLRAGQRCSFTATARWEEYNAGNSMWKKMPYLMLGKCAEALALRKGFPGAMGGLYTSEEMDQAGGDNRAPTPRTDVRPADDLKAMEGDFEFKTGPSSEERKTRPPEQSRVSGQKPGSGGPAPAPAAKEKTNWSATLPKREAAADEAQKQAFKEKEAKRTAEEHLEKEAIKLWNMLPTAQQFGEDDEPRWQIAKRKGVLEQFVTWAGRVIDKAAAEAAANAEDPFNA